MNSLRKGILPGLAFAVFAGACRDISSPPATRSLRPAAARFTISDGAHGGSTRLYFLPPFMPQPTFSGVFDPTAFAPGSSDEVFVCMLTGTQCGVTIATFTGGSGPSDVKLDTKSESYLVTWHTGSQQPPLDPSQVYRIVVRVNNIDVGYSDLIPVQLGPAPGNNSQYGFVRIGTTLPIAFRLETAPPPPPPPPPPSGPIDLRAFAGRTCIINASGQLVCWGADFNSPANPVPTPALFGPPQATYVALGGGSGTANHACAIGGTTGVVGPTSCWGNDTWGQLGNGAGDGSTLIYVSTPTPVNGQSFTTITMGAEHSCGLAVSGAAYCWGDNDFGQLGDGTTQLRNTPTLVSGGLTFKAISAGQFHTCGLTTQGAAYCWGSTANGTLGTNLWVGPNSQTTPIAVLGPNFGTPLVFASIAAGPGVTCAITADGTAYCWGNGGVGQLGNGTTSVSPWPSPVSGNLAFAQISIGNDHACGLTTAGLGYCWGQNGSGQLGNGTSTFSITTAPGPVSFINVTLTKISAGGNHTCAIATGGSVFCWGDNTLGEIGDGTTVNRPLPTLVNFP